MPRRQDERGELARDEAVAPRPREGGEPAPALLAEEGARARGLAEVDGREGRVAEEGDPSRLEAHREVIVLARDEVLVEAAHGLERRAADEEVRRGEPARLLARRGRPGRGEESARPREPGFAWTERRREPRGSRARLLLEEGDPRREPPLRGDAVGVEEGQDLAGRHRRPQVPHAGDRARQGSVEDTRSERARERRRAVLRAVIRDQDLRLGGDAPRRRAARAEDALEAGGLVARGDHDARAELHAAAASGERAPPLQTSS